MSHHKINFDENLQSFRFLYVGIDDGRERLFEKRYMVLVIYEAIEKFRKLNVSLAELYLKMISKGNIPGLVQ